MADDANMIDEDLHSRQLAVYGRENMQRLSTAHVLLVGINGLAAEVGKNIVLANVKKVTLQDTRTVQWSDLASGFCFTEADIGQNRATTAAPLLRELNTTVGVEVVTSEVTEDLLASASVVVCFDSAMEECVSYNKICRARNIRFIKADIRGFAGAVFVDNGNEFLVNDTTGEDAKTAIVAQISNGNPGVVVCTDDERIDFEDGDEVIFTEVHGMEELCDGVPRKVTVRNPYSFTIEDTTNYKPHSYGGIVTQVKASKILKFRSLEECIASPGNFFFDNPTKWQRPVLLHLGFLALDEFQKKHGDLPRPASTADADEIIATVKALSAKYSDCALDNVDEDVLRKLASGSRAQINPMAAFFGAVVGQEVLKAATGKFHPIHQWFYYDDFECLPKNELTAAEVEPMNSRYDGNIPVFGRSLQQKLNNMNIFLVGAGALGCEFLKNFALLGLGCSQAGGVTVTDDDKIEKSNLSRQFLFRNHNVGQNKSDAAGKAVKKMNPEFNVKPMQDRVSTQTENIFNDDFWTGLDFVVNALDNVPARMYVDQRCVFFGKALFESGTLGPKCNTQVVLPHLTENYGASADPAEKSAPECTLHNFPHNINHCLTWARSEFVGQFETNPQEVCTYLEAPGQGYVQKQYEAGNKAIDIMDKLSGCKSCIITDRCSTFEECVGWARRKFEEHFYNKVVQLTTIYPEDAVTSSGARFWSPPKRFPKPVTFDSSDPVHMGFIIAAANLRAFSYNIPPPQDHRNPAYFRRVLNDVVVPDFVPDTQLKIKVDEKDNSNNDDNVDEGDINNLVNELQDEFSRIGTAAVTMKVNEFEKDDDTNHHIDFIWAVGNLRARCYDIGEVEKLEAKLIAGKIIPAIATATAMATGLVCMEVIKYLNGHDDIEMYRNTFANLALPLLSQSEPFLPAKVKSRTEKSVPDPINHPEYVEEEDIQAYPEGHTVWDKIKMETGDCTLQEFIDMVKEQYKFKVTAFAFQSGAMIYNTALATTKANLPKRMSELLAAKGKPEDYVEGRKYISPVVLLENDNMEVVETPPFIVYFK